ncbi:unnamed protein product, partial [Urochloa humidicola]
LPRRRPPYAPRPLPLPGLHLQHPPAACVMAHCVPPSSSAQDAAAMNPACPHAVLLGRLLPRDAASPPAHPSTPDVAAKPNPASS